MLGVCECKPEFERQDDGICAPTDLKSLPDIISEKILDLANKSVPVTKKHLTVIAESKQVSPINFSIGVVLEGYWLCRLNYL